MFICLCFFSLPSIDVVCTSKHLFLGCYIYAGFLGFDKLTHDYDKSVSLISVVMKSTLYDINRASSDWVWCLHGDSFSMLSTHLFIFMLIFERI